MSLTVAPRHRPSVQVERHRVLVGDERARDLGPGRRAQLHAGGEILDFLAVFVHLNDPHPRPVTAVAAELCEQRQLAAKSTRHTLSERDLEYQVVATDRIARLYSY
jgi:hypothetical protein